MGDTVENVYYGPHAAAGQVTGWRVAIHKVTPAAWVELGDATGNDHAALMAAAKVSFTEFNDTATGVWGSAYSGLALGVRQSIRAAVAAY